MENLKDVVVIYHAHCPDGFGAAWSAWKKFGDSASYLPAKRGEGAPEGLENKEVYVVDYAWSKEEMLNLQSKVKRLVVIDHHKSSEEDVKALKENIFDTNYSGCYLTWKYFNKDVDVPEIIEYISDGDLNNFILPNADELLTYIYAKNLTFEIFDEMFKEFSTEQGKKIAIEKGKLLMEYRDKILKVSMESLHFIEFEGHTIPAVNVSLPMDERSYLVKKIYEKYPPFAMTYRYDDGQWKCSLRSDLSVDVSKLAMKYGGGGHPGSAGFAVSAEFPLPFAKLVEKKKD